MELIGNCFEDRFYNFFMPLIKNLYGVSALAGNWRAECGFKANNLQNSFQKKLGHTDESYTKAVDDGSYQNFVRDGAGYGCAQWTYWSRKQGLLNYAKEKGVSIGDEEMQFEYAWKELSQGYKSVLSALKNAKSVKEASYIVLTQYERPADQGSKEQAERTAYGEEFYKKYAKSEVEGGISSMATEKQIRERVVSIAKAWLGCKESDGTHKQIIDTYNAHKPLARGYAVRYTDAWCATYASAVAIKAGLTDIIPLECSCSKLIELAKKLGIWVENDAYIPEEGDFVEYDWQDSGIGDNKGNPDHIGMVVSVSGNTITVIEGNKNNAVEYRELAINGKYIRGFIAPDYASLTTKEDEKKGENGAEMVHIVKKGDTLSKIASKYDTTYQALAEYNGIKNPNVINVGQKIKIPVAGSLSADASTQAERTYTVKKGDSLWKIAVQQLGKGARYTEIKTLNGMKNNTIHAGQVLKIPTK